MHEYQESLLARSSNDRRSSHLSVRLSNFFNGTSRHQRNLLLLTVATVILICLGIYIYLNIQAVGNNLSGSQMNSKQFKPLSRRKPMLDHESIFESGQTMLKLSDLLAHCIVALQVAGQRVVNSSLAYNVKLEHVGSKGKTLEGVEDIVTGVDMESHHIIMGTLKDSYKRLRIISEEDTTADFNELHPRSDTLPMNRQEFARLLGESLLKIENEGNVGNSMVSQQETVVWIDPLDATKEYSENLTEYVTLMACIAHRSKPVAGVIYKPFTKELFWSIKDSYSGLSHHSFDLKNLIESGIQNKKKKLEKSEAINLIVSRSHAGQAKAFLEDAYGDRANVISAGGSGYKTVEVISGRVDAYVHLTRIKKWDVCGPHAIIHSLVGGNMTSLMGSVIEFGNQKNKVIDEGIIASANHVSLHQQLVELFAAKQTTTHNVPVQKSV